MKVPSRIKLISLDVWNTLIKPSGDYRATRARVIAEGIHWHGDVDAAAEALRAACDEMDDLMDQTGRCLNFAPRINLLCEKLSLPAIPASDMAELERLVMEAHRDFPPHLTEDDLLVTLAQLSDRGCQLAVMSNTGITSGETLRVLLADIGVLRFVSYELYSDEVGYSKPSPNIFAALAEKSGIAPEHTLHVGDNLVADYNGATASGLHALWYTTKEQNECTIPALRQLL